MGGLILVGLLACAPAALDPLDFTVPEPSSTDTGDGGVPLDNACAAALFASAGENPADWPRTANHLFCDPLGGWLLLGKVYRTQTAGQFLKEPRGFWQSGFDVEELGSPQIVDLPFDFQNGLSHGLASVASGDIPVHPAAVVRFELVHSDGPSSGQRDWYKEVTGQSDFEAWFGTSGTSTSLVCSDELLTQDCTMASLLDSHDLDLGGMEIVPGGRGLRMKLDGHVSAALDGVGADLEGMSSPWQTSNNTEWGHGMRIWIR
ncbi:MAG: hypothetical protein R3F61_06570 [Myxococcota bacterium]